MVTKGYGITVADIDSSCPNDLEPYIKAHEQEILEKDKLIHVWWGIYGLSAVSVAVEHCLAGKKAKSKYIDVPIMQKSQKNNLNNEESNEEVAVFEMKQRTNLLRQSGLPESPM